MIESAPSRGRREFRFVVDRNFTAHRTWAMMGDAYSSGSAMRTNAVWAIVSLAVATLAYFAFGSSFVVVLVIWLVCAVAVLIGYPVKLFVGFLRMDPARIPEGAAYTATYGVSGFKVRDPFGTVWRFPYVDLKNIHVRSSFLFFEVADRGRVVLPIEILPRGDGTWLRSRADEARI